MKASELKAIITEMTDDALSKGLGVNEIEEATTSSTLKKTNRPSLEVSASFTFAKDTKFEDA